jgi:hypothetical protein
MNIYARALVLATLFYFTAALSAQAPVVPGSMKITKVTVTETPVGSKQYSIEATAELTLGTNGKSVIGATFSFRRPDGVILPGFVTPFVPPAPGKTVTIKFRPFDNPLTGKAGDWTARAVYIDGNNQAFPAARDFLVPAP